MPGPPVRRLSHKLSLGSIKPIEGFDLEPEEVVFSETTLKRAWVVLLTLFCLQVIAIRLAGPTIQRYSGALTGTVHNQHTLCWCDKRQGATASIYPGLSPWPLYLPPLVIITHSKSRLLGNSFTRACRIMLMTNVLPLPSPPPPRPPSPNSTPSRPPRVFPSSI